MGFLDRLFGRGQQSQPGYQQQGHQQGYQQPAGQGYRVPAGYPQPGQQAQGAPRTEDEQAIARYRYLLRTAPPETVEQAHAEAFAKLTPQQRQQVLAEMSRDLPAAERPTSDDPATLARTATRAELRQPGFMERTFAGRGGMGGMGMGGAGGMGMGGMIMGSMLGSIAGMVIGTAIADTVMDGFDLWDDETDGGEHEAHGVADDQGFSGGDAMQDDGSFDMGGAQGQEAGFADSGFDSGFDGGGFDGGGFDMGGDFGGDF